MPTTEEMLQYDVFYGWQRAQIAGRILAPRYNAMGWHKTIAAFWLLLWTAGTTGASLGPALHGFGHDCECREWICICPHDKTRSLRQANDRQVAKNPSHEGHTEANEAGGPMCHKPDKASEQPCAIAGCGSKQTDDGLLSTMPATLPAPEALQGPKRSGSATTASSFDLRFPELQSDPPPPRLFSR